LPSYLTLYRSGELKSRIRVALAMQAPCRLCPRRCGVLRTAGERGLCEAGVAVKVFRYGPHFGEEPPLVGERGSGAVFFSGCGLRCMYCQNHKFSQEGAGSEISCEALAAIFIDLKVQGCHNLNLVTPSHFLPQILNALFIAVREGFDLPLMYNTSGYESVETLKVLDGIVDLYLSDMRYGMREPAIRYSNAPEYPLVNSAAIREMWRQVGPLVTDERGVAQRGLIIRHLVLPLGLAGTESVCRFLSRDISREVAFSLMSQYTPCYKARADRKLRRRITREEYKRARAIVEQYGFVNGWEQEWTGRVEVPQLLGSLMEGNV
jgi:putative pyruvate formate lyase activating enzyme